MSRQHHPGGAPLPSPDLLLSIIEYGDLFNKIDVNHPEADVRHRFLGLRATRARFVEGLVLDRERAWKALRKEVQNGKADPQDEDYRQRFANSMVEVDEALHWYSRVNEDDDKAASAPVVTKFFMELFRKYLQASGRSHRAPNGELRALYGSTGDAVSDSYFAVRDCDDDLIRHLVTEKLMKPFNRFAFAPLQTFYNWILRRDTGPPPQGLSGGTLDILVNAMECVIAVGWTAGSVVLLYNLVSTKDRLIAATFVSLGFPFAAVFFSREAMRIFTLTVGMWAVLIFFMSSPNLSNLTPH